MSKRVEKLSIVIPTHITLETFKSIINHALENSEVSYIQSGWNPMLDGEEQFIIKAREWELEPIHDKDSMILEFKEREGIK